MSNPADCTIGASVQEKIYIMVKYESLSVYLNKICQILLTVL